MCKINFCFWPNSKLEYHNIAGGLKKTFEENTDLILPKNLINLNRNSLCKILNLSLPEIPLIDERIQLLRETGRVIYYKFNGKVTNLIKLANNSCVNLVKIILSLFNGFNDCCINPINGKQIFFYKRVQIFC